MPVWKNQRIRKLLRIVIPLILIPAVLISGIFLFDEKRYSYCAFIIVLLSLLLFTAGYERRESGTRRMVLVSVMTALASAGRFLPFFKPVTALAVITGLYLGGEAGFLVGALSALISNLYFGQGPWTPFQMFAW